MAADPGQLASAQGHPSDGQRLQGHNLCENHREHEVFLSHSGMQKQFVHDLFNDFMNVPRFQNNEPFFDVQDASLPKGEEWKSRIIKAARRCKVAVMILTKDYLTSKWPMLELLYCIDAKKTTNRDMKLVPVFYDHLLPSHLSDQDIEDNWKGRWEKSFGKRAAKLREIYLTVESCKEALHFLKDINGIEAQKFKSLGLLRQDIVSKVLHYLPSGFEPILDPDVEGCRRLCDMIVDMFQEYDKGVQCLGMYGVGGSGKTTMCKALCSYLGPLFNHRVYHLQIGSNECVKSKENSIKRHEELLRKLIGLSQEEIGRIRDPREILKMHLGKQPVFLAVDDVREDMDSCMEVQAYMSYLCSGSKIIITARSRDIVESVIDRPDYCKSIPNLEEEEALSLFLKIAAPKTNLNSLALQETEILRDCLQICFFSREEGGSRDSFPLEAGGDPFVPTEDGHYPRHYHPLALRAVASYFKDLYSKLDCDIIRSGSELLSKKRFLFNSYASISVFDVLGISFHEIEHMDKQLFIDIALYAPLPDGDKVDIFDWLVCIHGSTPDLIQLKLKHLRKMSFLNYEDGKGGHSICINISMHELYKEYAKILVNKHENSYQYGVYIDQHYQAASLLASPDWTKAPRICLKRWKESKDVMKVKEWCWVSLIRLSHCDTITTFSIGRELVNLRELKIYDCSKLEELSWTQDVITEQLQGVMKLCFVDLSSNRSLRLLPDFSNCSELCELNISECPSSVEPLHLHTCPSLQLLHIAGKINAPEVHSLQSCLKLRSVQLTWKATHKGLVVGNLPSLSKLKIAGSSVLHYPCNPLLENAVPHGQNLFHRQYPEDTETDELTWIGHLTNLKTLHLNYIPLGCLPKGLRKIRSNLEDLNLRGCLLSQLVDFREFPNLRHLSVAQTNVKELRGIGGLTKLEYLDCRFNFQLRKIPDLRRLPMLKLLSLDLCSELQAIPRLPRSCFEIPLLPNQLSRGFENPPRPDDGHRLALAVDVFANTLKSAIPPPLFAINDHGIFGPSEGFILDIAEKLSHVSLRRGKGDHPTVRCDGCWMRPLIGPRYKAKSIPTTYHLCTKCFTNKCNRYDCNFIKSCCPETYHCTSLGLINYDLCNACFVKSGCDERDFVRIHQTANSSK